NDPKGVSQKYNRTRSIITDCLTFKKFALHAMILYLFNNQSLRQSISQIDCLNLIKTTVYGIFLLCLFFHTYVHRNNHVVLGLDLQINLQNDSCHSMQLHLRNMELQCLVLLQSQPLYVLQTASEERRVGNE